MLRVTMTLLLSLSCITGCTESAPLDSPPTPDPCQVDDAISAPKSIAETVTLINALPKPLALGCFLKSLKRPLYLDTSTGFLSAQPGVFERSPRILLVRDRFVLSVVPEGDGVSLLEMSEINMTTYQSLKGEVKFPIPSPIGPLKPYEDILYNETSSTCGFCHPQEQAHPSIPGAFTSLALRPVDDNRVNLDVLKGYAFACNAQEEPQRCAILQGIFGQGEVFDGRLSDEVPTLE